MVINLLNQDRNIFSINVELTSTFFNLQSFGPSPSPNFKYELVFTFLKLITFNCGFSVNMTFSFLLPEIWGKFGPGKPRKNILASRLLIKQRFQI